MCVLLQVGACIVNDKNIILSIGYNGFPRGCADTSLPWSKKAQSGSILDTKYPYVSGLWASPPSIYTLLLGRHWQHSALGPDILSVSGMMQG